jgi:hypothetical protein
MLSANTRGGKLAIDHGINVFHDLFEHLINFSSKIEIEHDPAIL